MPRTYSNASSPESEAAPRRLSAEAHVTAGDAARFHTGQRGGVLIIPAQPAMVYLTKELLEQILDHIAGVEAAEDRWSFGAGRS